MSQQRSVMDSKSMQALQVVMEHSGTENNKRLKVLCGKTEYLDYREEYNTNMEAWQKISADNLFMVCRCIKDLDGKYCNEERKLVLGCFSTPDYSRKEQILFVQRCLATRGIYSAIAFSLMEDLSLPLVIRLSNENAIIDADPTLDSTLSITDVCPEERESVLDSIPEEDK